ncbi:MAG: hypothetical protein M3P93_06360 [Actinomycetota bacterium]|nr:hypothetical protein [Actinomycetota bacterium]
MQHGWHQGDRTAYRRDLGLDPTELLTFLRGTQPQSWDKLVGLHGSTDKAQQRLSKRVADELTSRGTIDVLRRGVTDLGVHLACSTPSRLTSSRPSCASCTTRTAARSSGNSHTARATRRTRST